MNLMERSIMVQSLVNFALGMHRAETPDLIESALLVAHRTISDIRAELKPYTTSWHYWGDVRWTVVSARQGIQDLKEFEVVSNLNTAKRFMEFNWAELTFPYRTEVPA